MSDTDIIAGLHNSDAAALREVFDRYHQQLFRFLLYRTGDRMEAEDLVQDVYVRLWKYRKRVTDENLLGYLYSIAGSLSNNRVRQKNIELDYIQKKKASPAGDLAQDPAGGSDEVEEEVFEMLEKCVNGLPEKQRTTLLLNRSEGLTYKEIARYLELTQKAIEKRMQKAYELLRGCMEKFFNKK